MSDDEKVLWRVTLVARSLLDPPLTGERVTHELMCDGRLGAMLKCIELQAKAMGLTTVSCGALYKVESAKRVEK